MDDLLAEFLTEANESLAGLDEALLTLERAPNDRATVGLIFRLVHTIKGTCGFLGLPRLERVAHSAENVLGLMREGTLQATPTLITAVLQAIDVMKAIVTALGVSGTEPRGDDSAIIATMDAIFNGECVAEAPAPVGVAAPAGPKSRKSRTPRSARVKPAPTTEPVIVDAPANDVPALSAAVAAPQACRLVPKPSAGRR